MKYFVTVIQVSASKFDVMFFHGETSSRLFPQTSKHGVCVHIAEATKDSEIAAFKLAENMSK
jgi:hypothetical protein